MSLRQYIKAVIGRNHRMIQVKCIDAVVKLKWVIRSGNIHYYMQKG